MTGFGEIAERLRRSTVQVGPGGSGIVWDEAGTVITNAHVARGGSARVEFWDGTRVMAEVRRRDTGADLAELHVDGASGFTAVSVADSGKLRIGEFTVAVGNPLGFTGAVSTGVVHAVGPLRGLGGRRWIQSSVRLAPGNSGGPLANARGEVIGVNTMIVGGSLALAIPSAAVLRFLDRAEITLGVTVRPVASPRKGAVAFLVLETRRGHAADVASLMMGDLLTGANGRAFQTPGSLEEALRTAPEGRLSLQFQRGGGPPERTAYIQLRQREAIAA